MDKKSKIIFTITLVLVIIVFFLNYYKIFIIHNYKISFEAPCDPYTESCFILECDPEINEDCTNVPTEYYKLIERKVSDIISCKNDDFDCLSCRTNESNCKITNCDPSQAENICSSNQ